MVASPDNQDSWVSVEVEGYQVIADSWSCWRVLLDAETGRERTGLHEVAAHRCPTERPSSGERALIYQVPRRPGERKDESAEDRSQ